MYIVQKSDDGKVENQEYFIVSDVSRKILRTFKTYEEALEVFHRIKNYEGEG